MVGLTATSSKNAYANKLCLPELLLPVVLTLADHCRTTALQKTPTHSQASWLSLLWGHCSFPLSPGAHKVLPVSSKSLYFLQSCGSSVIKSHWTFKSGDSQSLCQIPRLGNLMCILEPSQQCENFFGIIFSSFWVTHLVALW